MSKLEEQVKQLRNTIFNMLNFTNMYILVLNEKMEIKFANNSLAIDLGFDNYHGLLGLCWLDFIDEKERSLISTIHASVAHGYEKWEEKYREFQNNIKGRNGNIYSVYWFNSHINSDYNWTFSFGIKKQPAKEITMDSVRTYYQDIISKDRIMINSMRDIFASRDKDINTCEVNM